jgi:hypothetical protein
MSPELLARIAEDNCSTKKSSTGWARRTKAQENQFRGLVDLFNAHIDKTEKPRSIRWPQRTPDEEKQFRKLAALCGIRIDKLGKRKRRGYRRAPISAFT